MDKVLIYGFEPFRRYRKNITQELLLRLAPRPGLSLQILPVRFDAEIFLAPIEAFQPNWVLGLGQCPRGELLRIERRGFNQMRDRSQELDQPISPDLPGHLSVTWKLPVRSDSRLSYDAGRYVCNYSIYLLSQYARSHNLAYAFVHIPKHYSLNKGLAWLESLLSERDGPVIQSGGQVFA
jgi:pyrrolidone-carboxylate peptidase